MASLTSKPVARLISSRFSFEQLRSGMTEEAEPDPRMKFFSARVLSLRNLCPQESIAYVYLQGTRRTTSHGALSALRSIGLKDSSSLILRLKKKDRHLRGEHLPVKP